MTENKITSENSRIKTDKSLKFERNKTDNYLVQESKSVEDESDETVHLNRVAADKKLEKQRASDDSSKSDPERLTPQLDAERVRSDEAQQVARDKEDQIRNSERYQKRLITEAFLENERKDTDSNLSNERKGMDRASKEDLILVTNAESALVTRDQYLAIVSHDLKNPLSAISLSASTMRRAFQAGTPDSATLIKSLEVVERNVATMDRMISDLLDVERMGNGGLVLVKSKYSINKLLDECKEIFAPAVHSKSFTMKVDPCAVEIFSEFDHDRVLQVLSNLIGNALKFTPNGGVIELSAKKNDKSIEIYVKDNGPGIPEGKKDEIFERFSQLKLNDRRGLGLGLFISKWVVEAHGGSIDVVSNSGNGSTFCFTLPAF